MLVVKKLPAIAGDVKDAGSIPGLGRSPGGGHGNPSILACRIPRIVHGVAKSQIQLKWLSTYIHTNFQDPLPSWSPCVFWIILQFTDTFPKHVMRTDSNAVMWPARFEEDKVITSFDLSCVFLFIESEWHKLSLWLHCMVSKRNLRT